MRSERGRAISDVFYLLLMRLKLIRKDLTTFIVFIGSILLFALMIRTITLSVEDLSALPIGVVDYDHTDSSEELIEGLKKIETLRITELNEKKLIDMLKDELLFSVFVIEEGFEEKLKDGDLKDIVTMYYKKNNKSATIISDIVAGELIYPASFFKAYKHYEKLSFEGKKHSFSEYKEFIDNLIREGSDFDFSFDIRYASPANVTAGEDAISNTILYNQLIFGILGILIAFIAMFILSQTVREKEIGIEVRLRISRFYFLKRDLGNLLALLFCDSIISLIMTALIFMQHKSTDIKLWLSAFLLLLINAMALGTFMLLMSKLMKRIAVYQIFCSILILFTGGLGFYHLLTGFYDSGLENIVKFIPNSWFIKGFTDIMVYGSSGGYIKDGHIRLSAIAAVILLTVIVIDLFYDIHSMNIFKKNRTVKLNGQKDAAN